MMATRSNHHMGTHIAPTKQQPCGPGAMQLHWMAGGDSVEQ